MENALFCKIYPSREVGKKGFSGVKLACLTHIDEVWHKRRYVDSLDCDSSEGKVAAKMSVVRVFGTYGGLN
jgi:hypothetical protein